MGQRAVSTQESQERAFLVAVVTRDAGDDRQTESTLDELSQLAMTAGAEVVGKLVQRRNSPSPSHYLGKGKLEELQSLKGKVDFNLVIADDELTAQQQHNLEESLEVKIVDRVALILDIFARRARTREGQLQVELAQHQYRLSHLAGKWSHLERLGAGIGTRGPGESQLETDRRLIRQKIQRLEERIEQVRRHRELYRDRRRTSGVPIVALVGYTNAGKSTLLNALTHADVFVKDELFSTLDPTTRRLTLPDNSVVLMTDTVGFIRKLPSTIVTAFRATLEELTEASLLIHVVDFTSPQAAEQCQTVEGILAELNLAHKPRITAVNKIDRVVPPDLDEKAAIDYLSAQCLATDLNTALISAEKRWGLGQLLALVSRMLTQKTASKDRALQ